MRITRVCLTCARRTGGLRDCRTIERVTSEPDLVRWLAAAKPGDVAEYHRGFLLQDLASNRLDHHARAALSDLAGQARQLSDQGFVHLVQARLGAGDYRYLAVASKTPRRERC